ncbi:MAG: TolC family protein [Actinobacteria bacterium]|nr:TolC family protein [Actinomycetota bacterium]
MAALALPLLTGCTVGPNYHRPETPVPEKWVEVLDGVTAQPVSLVRWWTVFNYPLLDRLVERAISSNRNLQLAEARILQALAQRTIAAAAGLPTLKPTGSYSRYDRSNNAFSSVRGVPSVNLRPLPPRSTSPWPICFPC